MDRCQPRRRRPLQPHLLALALLLASPLAKAGTGLQQQQQQQQQQEHRQLLVGVGDLGWVASWISNALATGEGVLIHPVLRPSHCLDGGGGPVKSSWSTFYALTWECNNRAWQFWQHNGFHLWTNLSWKQAWRDFCLRRAAQAGPDEWGGAKGPPIGALVADCNANAGLNQIGFEPDHDASERPNLQLHPRTQSIMFRIVWRNPDPASREAYCLTDHGAEPAAFEKCRGGGKRYALPYPREEEGAPPYSTFTDPAQLWTIPRPFAGVETDGR